MEILRFDIWMVDLGDGLGSEQRGRTPCVVIQNNIGNRHSNTTVVIPMTSRDSGFHKTHVLIENTLHKPSYVMCEQIRVVDKSRFIKKIGFIKENDKKRIESVAKVQLGMVY